MSRPFARTHKRMFKLLKEILAKIVFFVKKKLETLGLFSFRLFIHFNRKIASWSSLGQKRLRLYYPIKFLIFIRVNLVLRAIRDKLQTNSFRL